MKIQPSPSLRARSHPVLPPPTRPDPVEPQSLGGCPPKLAAFAAELCALAYRPLAEVEATLRRAHATEIATWDIRGTQAAAFVLEGRNWIVFRGSDVAPETEIVSRLGSTICSRCRGAGRRVIWGFSWPGKRCARPCGNGRGRRPGSARLS